MFDSLRVKVPDEGEVITKRKGEITLVASGARQKRGARMRDDEQEPDTVAGERGN
jgi:hypothetical protein